MFPTFDFLGRTFGLYPIMAIIGGLTAGAWAMRTAKKRGHDDNDILMVFLIAAIGILVGGSLLYAFVNGRQAFTALWPTAFTSVSAFFLFAGAVFGGSIFYGGLLGGIVAAFITIRCKALPLGEYSDMAAPAIPLFHTFGRIGCFLGGCCYGVPWQRGPVYTLSPVPGANGIPRFPVQLAEAAFDFLLFLLLARLLKRGACKNRLLALYLLAYSAARFGLEFLRGDAYRGFALGFSTSQLISILLFCLSLSYLIYSQTKKSRSI